MLLVFELSPLNQRPDNSEVNNRYDMGNFGYTAKKYCKFVFFTLSVSSVCCSTRLEVYILKQNKEHQVNGEVRFSHKK